MPTQHHSKKGVSFVSRIKVLNPPMVFMYLYILLLGVHVLLAGKVKETFVILQTLLFVMISRWTFVRHRITFPRLLEYTITLFFIGTLIFGEVFRYYDAIWWWDLLFHVMAGFIVSYTAYLLLVYLLRIQGTINSLSHTQILLMAVVISLVTSGVWELYEFTMDHFFTLYMQPSREDTLHDLVAGSGGALMYLLFELTRRISFFVHREEIMIQVGRRKF